MKEPNGEWIQPTFPKVPSLEVLDHNGSLNKSTILYFIKTILLSLVIRGCNSKKVTQSWEQHEMEKFLPPSHPQWWQS